MARVPIHRTDTSYATVVFLMLQVDKFQSQQTITPCYVVVLIRFVQILLFLASNYSYSLEILFPIPISMATQGTLSQDTYEQNLKNVPAHVHESCGMGSNLTTHHHTGRPDYHSKLAISHNGIIFLYFRSVGHGR